MESLGEVHWLRMYRYAVTPSVVQWTGCIAPSDAKEGQGVGGSPVPGAHCHIPTDRHHQCC